jgi:hypothetical protein
MGDAADDDYARYEVALSRYESYIENRTWVTQTGKEIHVTDMETDHIENAINLLKNNRHHLNNVWIRIFEEELDLRGVRQTL